MPIPKKGSIPGRKKPKGLGDLLDLLGLKGIEELLNAAEKLANLKGDERAKEDVRKMREGLGKTKGITQNDVTSSGLGGLFKGIFDFVEKASKEGGELTQKFAGGKGIITSGIRGRILGKEFGGNLPLDRREPQEKFTVKRHEPKVQPGVQKIRKIESEGEMQPNLDVFDEKDFILITGDMPGVNEEEIKHKIEGNLLTIWTEGNRKYRKEIELSVPVTEEVNLKYRNGVLEMKLIKK